MINYRRHIPSKKKKMKLYIFLHLTSNGQKQIKTAILVSHFFPYFVKNLSVAHLDSVPFPYCWFWIASATYDVVMTWRHKLYYPVTNSFFRDHQTLAWPSDFYIYILKIINLLFASRWIISLKIDCLLDIWSDKFMYQNWLMSIQGRKCK